MLCRLRSQKQNLPSSDSYTRHQVGFRSYKYVRVLTYLPSRNIPIYIINFVIATISFILNVAGDLPDLQAPPQLCSIKNKTDSDNIKLDNNNNNNNNNNNDNNNNNNNDNNNK